VQVARNLPSRGNLARLISRLSPPRPPPILDFDSRGITDSAARLSILFARFRPRERSGTGDINGNKKIYQRRKKRMME